MPKQIEIGGTKYNLVSLDFETYYETNRKDAYSLKNKDMNMSDYVRDKRFLAQCVGLKKGASKTKVWFYEDIEKAVQDIDWSRSAMLCHNNYFDGLITSHHYDVVPAFYADTMCMSRILHGAAFTHSLDYLAKLYGMSGKKHGAALVNAANIRVLDAAQRKSMGLYCEDDVNQMYELFKQFLVSMDDSEMRLIDRTIRMFADPVLRVDKKRINAVYDYEVQRKADLLKEVESLATKKDLMSNDKFAALLTSIGVDPPMKISPTTGKATYAFAKNDFEFIDLLEGEYGPLAQALAEARVGNKTSMEETRALRLARAGEGKWRIPVHLNYCGAHTFRWSGGNKLNFQNFKRGSEMRKSILAPPGHVLVVADSAQIEARTLAWLAGEQWLVDAFANGDDVYKLFAGDTVYNVPLDEVTKDQRFVGKVCILGLGYGMGAPKLNNTLALGAMGPPVVLPMDETKRIVNAYRKKNATIVALWSTAEQILIDMILGRDGSYGPLTWGKDHIGMPNGHFMYYRGISGEMYQDRYGRTRLSNAYFLGRNNAKSYIYGGKATENWVQCLARIIVGIQLLEISDSYRVVMTTHDEIGACVPKKQAEKCHDDMIRIMSTAPDWAEGLPLGAEGGWDVCYSK